MSETIKDIQVTHSVRELAWIITELPEDDGTTERLKKLLRSHVDIELGLT